MAAKSLKEWIDEYESKTGDKFFTPAGFRLYWLPERGFASMKPDFEGKMLIIWQVCGDGKFWRDAAELYIANALGLETLISICTRPVIPYMRAFHWEVLDEECVNGQYRYLCQDSAGRAVVLTHKDSGNKDNPNPEYWVTHYIKRKAARTFAEFFGEDEKAGE